MTVQKLTLNADDHTRVLGFQRLPQFDGILPFTSTFAKDGQSAKERIFWLVLLMFLRLAREHREACRGVDCLSQIESIMSDASNVKSFFLFDLLSVV